MLILGLDLETTGLDTANDRIIELGAVAWDTEKNQITMTFSQLTKPRDWDGKLSLEVQEVTKIDPELLTKYGTDLNQALVFIHNIMSQADYIVAHNGNEFDKPLLEAEFKRMDWEPPTTPWIDTTTDVKWRPDCTGRRLTHIAADHKVLNPFPHRAVTDVLTMLTVIAQYDINEIVARSKEPNVTAIAGVSYDDREKAKAAGFKWDGARKRWFLRCKESEFKTLDAKTDFPLVAET